MANNFKRANAAVNAGADAIWDLLDNGYLRIYDGAQPATADTALGAQVLLAELRFNATSAPGASAGVVTANAFTQDSSANADGTAAWFRALESDGTTPVFDGSVGTSSADLVLNSTSIVTGIAVEVTSFVYTETKSA